MTKEQTMKEINVSQCSVFIDQDCLKPAVEGRANGNAKTVIDNIFFLFERAYC